MDAIAAKPGIAKISCSNLWKLYGSNAGDFLANHSGNPSPKEVAASGYICAVREASLEIYPGEIFVIMGLSGSGKSTLLRCLSKLISPTVGKVAVDGVDILSLNEAELRSLRRSKMGMVFQNFALLPHATVLENVAFPLTIKGCDKRDRQVDAQAVIDFVGLKGRENYYPRELSGGQQQRVGIARALTAKPEILFMDEPFSALDPLIRREMQDELIRLQKTIQKTIVMVTHDFDEAIRLADRIAIMRDGEIIQTGSPEEFISRPADDYVRKFTGDVQKARVLPVSSLMSGDLTESLPTLRVQSKSRIVDIAAELLDNDSDALVVDDQDQPVGILAKARVVDVLLNR
ncbi:MAG: ATP-binding cassette domain-containing protein [Mesorhizobium sp.]|nr:MAG: ATP-binding cassette domain-containing protein [Mesorhizobium sp.]